jgi:DNA-binding Lrp family transcriptional regulator
VAGAVTSSGATVSGSAPAPPLALDDLDRRIIACLQADGRASWTAIARRCDTSVATAARRGQRLLTNRTLQVTTLRTSIWAGASTMFVLRITCRAGARSAVVAQLAQRPSIRFLALVAGRHDIVAEVSADPGVPLYQQLASDYEAIEGIERCEVDVVLREHKVASDWSWQLLEGEAAATTVHEPHVCHSSHLDDWDRRIVEIMREDGRLPFSAVAARVGLDETTVRRRFETSSARGCVRTLTLVPAAALGFTSELLLDLSVDPERLHDVADRLTRFPGVRFVADTLNRGSLLCELIQPDVPALHSFLSDTIARLEGVRGWEASMELLTVRRGYAETPWWRAELGRAAAGADVSTLARDDGRRRMASSRSPVGSR